MQVWGLKSTFLESRKITIQKRELIIEEVHIFTSPSSIIHISELPAFLTLNQSAASSGLTYTLPAVFFILSPERL